MNMHHYRLLASAVLFLSFSSCVLNRSPIISFTDLTPREYCAGDTLTASYDFLREASCPAGVDCTPHFPEVSMRSEPELFTPFTYSPRSYRGSIMFPSSGSSVTLVTTAPATVNIPTTEFRDGGRVFLSRTGYPVPERRTARLFNGSEQIVNHNGMCMGATPGHSGGEMFTAPQFSERLEASEICNRNGVAINVNVMDAAGRSAALNIPARECRTIPRTDLNKPVRYTVTPQMFDPGVRCSSVDGGNPPGTLTTAVRYACRP